MSNPNSRAGIRFEQELVRLLRRILDPQKYTIVRSAGSKGPVDIVVLKHVGREGRNREYFGIQCKTKKDK